MPCHVMSILRQMYGYGICVWVVRPPYSACIPSSNWYVCIYVGKCVCVCCICVCVCGYDGGALKGFNASIPNIFADMNLPPAHPP